MSFIDRISGSRPFAAASNAIKKGIDAARYDDEGILDVGNPSKVYMLYDEDADKTSVRLFDDEECFHQKSVEGDRRDYYKKLFYKYTDIPECDIVTMAVKNGGRPYSLSDTKVKSAPVRPKMRGEKALELDSDTKAQVAKALINMQQEDRAPRTFLDGPIKLKHFDDSKRHKMTFGMFLSETYDSKFDIIGVLDNVSRIENKSFKVDKIDSVIVGKGGTTLSLITEDGKSASFDFTNGRRMIDSTDEEGIPSPFMDFNGPVIRKKGYADKGIE